MSAAAAPAAALPAATAPAGALLRWFPSLRDVVLLLPLLFLFTRLGGAGFLLGDGDTGWHIRTGEWILTHGAPPQTDIFSFTKAGQPWFAWEWLWDVTFGWLHLHYGMWAVLLSCLAVISLTLYLVYRECCRAQGNFVIAFAIVFLVAAGSTIHWLARPHLFSMLFTAAAIALLNRAQEGRLRLLAWLPLLTILWVNLHGGFFILWTLLIACAAGAALTAFLDHASPWRAARPYLYSLAACLAASFLNPYSWRLHRHIFGYLSETYHREMIQEFLSISFHNPAAVYFAIFLLLGAMAALWNLERRRFSAVLIFVAWGWLALYAARNIPILFIAAAPATALAWKEMIARGAAAGTRFSPWLDAFLRGQAEFAPMERAPRIVWLPLCAAPALALLFTAPAPASQFRSWYDPQKYPEGALPAIRALGPGARLFANDEWGDFLLYRLYPNFRAFIDGRSDFYGEKIGDDMGFLLNARHDWQQILSRYRIDAVLLRADEPLASTLKLSPRWRLLHDDGVSLLFQPVPETARVHAAAATVNRSTPESNSMR